MLILHFCCYNSNEKIEITIKFLEKTIEGTTFRFPKDIFRYPAILLTTSFSKNVAVFGSSCV